MQQDIPIMKQKYNAAMIALCPGQVWWSWVHAPLRKLSQLWPTLFPQNCTRKRAKSSITEQWIIRYRSNFVQSLNAWHPKGLKSSRSRGQRSRSQHDITCAKICKIINNSAGDCSISLKFRTDFDHVRDVPRTWVKLGENYARAERNTYGNVMFKVIRSNTEIAITPPRIAQLRSNVV